MIGLGVDSDDNPLPGQIATDRIIRGTMVMAMKNTMGVYDMSGTKPWQHFRRMLHSDFVLVADAALRDIKRKHRGRDVTDIIEGYNFSDRLDKVLHVMRVRPALSPSVFSFH